MSTAAPDATLDYSLDERQRNMLEAMGIKLWLPMASQVADAAPAPQAATKPAEKSAFVVNTEPNQPLPLIKSTQIAIKAIAPETPSRQPVQREPASSALAPHASGIEQMDWPALQMAVPACQACGLCQSRKNTVFGVGQLPPDAAQAPQVDWLIVGDPPDEDEDRSGEPFSGPAGKLLDNMLGAMKMSKSSDGKLTGLSRQSGVYITNVLKCRPPANRNPSPEEVAMCEPYLARQIALLRPKIILAMGKFAIQSLTGSNDPVGKLRGRVHALKHDNYQAPVIVTYHPAYLLRNLPDKAKAWADLQLAMKTYSEVHAAD